LCSRAIVCADGGSNESGAKRKPTVPGPKGKSGIALGALLMVAAPLIVHYEGNVPHTYADVNGVATVCAGETGPDVTWGMKLTMAQCLERLDKRLAVEWGKFEPCIQRPITIN
jgi:hypothetical protein